MNTRRKTEWFDDDALYHDGAALFIAGEAALVDLTCDADVSGRRREETGPAADG